MTRTVRSALLALLVTAAALLASAFLTAPAQAAPSGDSVPAATGSALPRTAHRPAAKAQKADVKRVGPVKAGTTARAPLPGFCTLDGYNGVTSFIGCSVVIPATVYVYCDNGNIFYGYLPYPGVYSLSATPCYATHYSLV